MPGQYYDAETGLTQNYFRDYDSATGRYIESDPIGLDGGTNTYGYAGADPIELGDPFGLQALLLPTPSPSTQPYFPPRAPVIPFPGRSIRPGPVPGLGGLLGRCLG